MGAILAALARIGTLSLGALFGNWKSWLVLSAMGFAMINLYNLYVEIVQETLTFVMTQVQSVGGGGTGPPVMVQQFVGLAGWLATKLRLVECFSVVLNTVLLKWSLVKIPFLTW